MCSLPVWGTLLAAAFAMVGKCLVALPVLLSVILGNVASRAQCRLSAEIMHSS